MRVLYLSETGIREALDNHSESAPSPLVRCLDRFDYSLAGPAQTLARLVAHLGHLLLGEGRVDRSALRVVGIVGCTTSDRGTVVGRRIVFCEIGEKTLINHLNRYVTE